MANKFVVRTGPDRWQIDMNDNKGGFRSGWVDFWVVEAIASVIRQIDSISDRVRVELIIEDEGDLKPEPEQEPELFSEF